MKILILIAIMSVLTGCIPEIPEVPTSATCTTDGFVLVPEGDINNPDTWRFVLDEEGRAMTCTLG